MIKRVLVIDDNPAAQNEVQKELENDCTEVICVGAVREALQTFLSREFALVILDADLSECDGYRLLEVMQTAKPILALSSKSRHPCEETDSIEYEDAIHAGTPYCLRDSLKIAKREICSCTECETTGKYHYALVCGKDLIINPDRREALLKGQSLELTKKEFDLLWGH